MPVTVIDEEPSAPAVTLRPVVDARVEIAAPTDMESESEVPEAAVSNRRIEPLANVYGVFSYTSVVAGAAMLGEVRRNRHHVRCRQIVGIVLGANRSQSDPLKPVEGV